MRPDNRAFLLLSFLCAACGGGDDGAPSGANTAPVASAFTFTPQTGSVGVALSLSGSLAFEDAEGNLATLTLRLQLPDGTTSAATSTLVANAAGITVGTVPFALTLTPELAGSYVLEAWLTDAAGAISATLTATLVVTGGSVPPGNSAPTVSSLAFAPTSAAPGDSVTVKGSFEAADVDGNLKAHYARFKAPDGTALPTSSGLISGPSGQTSATISFSVSLDAEVAGTYTLEVWADDKDDALSAVITGTFEVAATAPAAPVIENLSVLPATAKVGQAVNVHGQVGFTDADGDVQNLHTRFKRPDGSYDAEAEAPLLNLASPKAGNAQIDIDYTPSMPGEHTFEVWLSDAAGNDSNVLTAPLTVTDTVVPTNVAPVSANVVLAPTSAFTGDFVKATGTFDASDADGNLSIWYGRFVKPDGTALATSSGVISGPSNQKSATIAFTTYVEPEVAGTWTFEAWVKDTQGELSNVSTASLAVTTLPPSPPVATKLELTPKAVKTGLSVKYSGQVGFKDADGDLKALHLRFQRPDGSYEPETIMAVSALSTKTAGNVLFSTNTTATVVGSYTLEAWLVDSLDHKSNVMSAVVVATVPFIPTNEAPVASGLVFEPESAVLGEAVTMKGSFTASDADGNLSTWTVRLVTPAGTPLATSSGVISGSSGQTSAVVTFTSYVVPAVEGIWTIEAWAEDDEGAASNVQVGTIEVGQPDAAAPVASNLLVTPAGASTGVSTSYTGQLSFVDADGDVASLSLRFRRPGDLVTAETVLPVTGLPVPTAGTVPVAIAYTAPSAGTYALEAWLTDDLGHQSNVVSQAIVVTSVPKANNSVPVVSNLLIGPATAFTGQGTTFAGTFDATDIDANLATMHLRFKKPSGIGLPEQSSALSLPDPSGGQATFALPLTPDVAGKWTFEAYVKDTSGAKSNTATGNFTVSAPPSTVPVALAVTFQPASAEAGAKVAYSGAISVTDYDGDLTTAHVRFKRPGGTVSAETTIPVTLLADPTAGDAPFTVEYAATVAGTYTLEAWVKDAKGQKSLVVTGDLAVAEAPAAPSSAPIVEDLQFSPTTAAVGVPVSLVGSFFATDLDKDWSTAHYRFRKPSGVALPEASVAVPGLGGKASGTVSFTRQVTPDMGGEWQLEVTLKDLAGTKSATVAASFTVEAPVLPSETAPSIKKLTVQPLAVLVDKPKTLTGTVDIEDSDGDVEVLTLGLVDPTGAALPETLVTLTGFAGKTAFSAPFTLEFTAEMVGDYVLEAWVDDLAGQGSNIAAATIVASDLSNVNSACAALEVDCTGQGFCYDVNSTTCDYLDSKQIDFPTCDEVGPTGTVPACVSSIEDTSSPYAMSEANCGFVQYWSNPTVFPIDCRCSDAGFESPCKRPYELSSVISFGEGPRPRTLATEMRLWNGPVDGREWFVPAFWKTSSKPNQTMIYAVHLDTGNRRFFSGTYNDPANGLTHVGEGPDFVQVMDMDKGADGQFYAVGAASEISEPKIWRVDPATGNRTLIFDAATAPASALCPNGSTLPGTKVVQMAAQGWAMDAQGRFYFSNVNQPGPSIVRIAADGKKCEYVTSVVDVPSNTLKDVGGGYDDFQFDFRAFHIEGDKLYAVSNTMFVEMDIPTGNRKLLSKATDVGNIGAGPINAEGLGDRYTRWDPYRKVFWTVGVLGGNAAIAVDPTTGNRFTWPCWHPTLGGPLTACGGTGKALIPGYLNFGGFVIDPEGDHNLYFAHDTFAIVKYDVKTGNAYTFSL